MASVYKNFWVRQPRRTGMQKTIWRAAADM
jgi:hypothetical protein